MNPLVIDCETTTFEKGHPFAQRNKLCLVGTFNGINHVVSSIEYRDDPYGPDLLRIQQAIIVSDLLVFFNAKFDLHWLRRYGIDFKDKKIWDLQYAHFCLTGQEIKYPSLDGVLNYYQLPLKYDKVKLEYWDRNIDTPEIPLDVLEPYLKQDCVSEWKVFQKQIEELKDKPQLKKLIWYGCQDILVTEEMEWNGLKFDLELSLKLGEECLDKIREIDRKLGVVFGDYPFVNWNSGDHLSAILYGGVLKYKGRESVSRVLKDGRVSVRERDVVKEVTLPTLVEPLKGTNLKKEGYYETNEGVLKSLKAYGKAKAIISLVLERAKIDKELGTYYNGFPKLYKEKDWTDSILHGQLNHCVTKTGRLSSSAPNQQNLSEGIKQCLISRFQ